MNCSLCRLPHKLPSETDTTIVARLMIEAMANAMEHRHHMAFARWLRRLNKKVDMEEYFMFDRVFTVFRMMNMGGVQDIDEVRLMATMRRKFPWVLRDRWVRELAGDFVGAAPVNWPTNDWEDEHEAWQDFIDGLHGVVERRPILLFLLGGRSGRVYPKWTMDLVDPPGYSLLHAACSSR
jgi:hypothetical protein